MSSRPTGARNAMYLVGVLTMVGVALYLGFTAVNGWGLSEKGGRASVVAKERVDPGSTYATRIIGGQRVVTRQETPELYVLELEMNGRRTPAAVAPGLFESVEVGDEVAVTYEERRITGALRVLSVER